MNPPTASSDFRIAPSLLSADFWRVGEQVQQLQKAGCRMVHLDIMDGHFVPNMTFGPPVAKSLARSTDIEFDVHLMVTDSDAWTEAFDFPNTRCITVHAESGYHIHRSLQKIRDRGKMAGISLNPATSEEVLEYLWPYFDLVLVMSVNPGFGGQSFIESCREKVRRIRRSIDERTDGRVVLEIDGGIDRNNLVDLVGLGVQWVVTGNALFSAENLGERFRSMQQAGSEAWMGRTR